MAKPTTTTQLAAGMDRLQRQAVNVLFGKPMPEQRRLLPKRTKKAKKPMSHRVVASLVLAFMGLAALPAFLGLFDQPTNPMWWALFWIFGVPAGAALAFLANWLPESNASRAQLALGYVVGYVAVPLLVALLTNFNTLVLIMAIVIDGIFLVLMTHFSKALALHVEGYAA